MPNLGLYLGSFQPFHNDHLKHLKFILTQNDRCLIIIVRQEDKTNLRNKPFDDNLTYNMIKASLKEEGILDKVFITFINNPDNFKELSCILNSYSIRYNITYFTGKNNIYYQTNKEIIQKKYSVYTFDNFAITGKKIRDSLFYNKQFPNTLPIPKGTLQYLNKISIASYHESIDSETNFKNL